MTATQPILPPFSPPASPPQEAERKEKVPATFSRAFVEYTTWFSALQEGLGMTVGQDIWRFTFPPLKDVERPAPRGICLTNNHVVWREEEPCVEHNHPAGGSYSLRRPTSTRTEAAR